jgi:hypothetical protein
VDLVKWLKLEIRNKDVRGSIPCKNFIAMPNIRYMAIYMLYNPEYAI